MSTAPAEELQGDQVALCFEHPQALDLIGELEAALGPMQSWAAQLMRAAALQRAGAGTPAAVGRVVGVQGMAGQALQQHLLEWLKGWLQKFQISMRGLTSGINLGEVVWEVLKALGGPCY